MKNSNLLLVVVVFATLIFGLWPVNSKAQYTKLLEFNDINGNYPLGSLIYDGTYLYGMTEHGGTNDSGVVFKIMPDGTGYSKLLDFSGTANGSFPYSSLISDSTFLYGMTLYGGTYGYGVIFKIKPDGTSYSKLLDFSGVNGSNPYGSLIYENSFLYGMTHSGGAFGKGVIFKIKTDGTEDTILLNFSGTTNGSNPWGSLYSDGTFLYGMASGGGKYNRGLIFKIKNDGTGYDTIMNFTNINGNYPSPTGSLISDGIFLYGMTNSGGINNYGTIFKIMPDGTNYSKLFDFTGFPNGRNPFSDLIYDGTFLYGMTSSGGSNFTGVFFKIKPDGTGFDTLVNFIGINGNGPYGSLIYDGTFLYGMTPSGGINDKGVIFKYGISNCSAIFIIAPDSIPHHYNIIKNASSGIPPFTYYWSWGDGTFDTTAYPTHTYDTAGTYTICLTITDSVGCTDTYCDSSYLQKSPNSVIYVQVIPNSSVGISKNEIPEQVLIYPNPSNGKITISQTDNLKSIEVFNLLGENIYKSIFNNNQTIKEIDLSTVPKGIYFVKIDNGKKVHIEKVVLN